MRDHDDLPYIVIERHSGGAAPFLWGALIGAGIALLLAPRSGAETQEEIRSRVLRLRSEAEGRVNEARDRVTRTRGRIFDRIDSVRSAIEEQADRARDAVDTGRRVAKDARSELERRLAEAKGGYGSRGDDGLGRVAGGASEADMPGNDVFADEADERQDLG